MLFLIKYLEIGKIVNAYGTNGEVKVIPLTDDPKRFFKLKWAFIGDDNSMEKFSIENVSISRKPGDTIIIKFTEINNRNEAELLKGLFIKIDRRYAVELPENTFFICDLIGCRILDEASNKELGILEDVIATGSNDVYVVKSEDKKDILVPALKSVVKKVSIQDKKMWVLLPDGLIDNDF